MPSSRARDSTWSTAAGAPPGSDPVDGTWATTHDLAGDLAVGAGDAERDLTTGGGIDGTADAGVVEAEGDGDAGQNRGGKRGEREAELGRGACHLSQRKSVILISTDSTLVGECM